MFAGEVDRDAPETHVPTLKSRVPSLYHRLLPVLDASYPEERFATCSDCVLCQSTTSPYLSTKCCAYYPVLPNFLVGGILETTSASEGARRVREVLASGVGVSPYGLLRPLDRLPHKRVLPTRSQLEHEMCPYYFDGLCGIWEYRNHMCATHHCLSVSGPHGHAFWDALSRYLKRVEAHFALFALTAAGMPRPADGSTPFDSHGEAIPAWMDWTGCRLDPERFYRECYAAVFQGIEGSSSLAAVPGLLDLEGDLLQKLAPFNAEAFPEGLRLTGQGRPSDDARYVEFGGTEPVRIPGFAAPFLRLFDGRRATTDIVRHATRLGVNICTYIPALRRAGLLDTVDLTPPGR